MKKIFLFLLISSFSFSYSQSYTEKYNDLYNRYEYFNNRGKMIGYKYYDNLYRVWKYKGLSNNSENSYVDPINGDRVEDVLEAKENKYNVNTEKIRVAIRDIQNKINEMDMSEYERNKKQMELENKLKYINSKKIDYSNNNTTAQILNYLYQ